MEWKRITVVGIGAAFVAGIGIDYVKEHYDQIDRQYDRQYQIIQKELGRSQERFHRLKEQDYGPLLGPRFL